MLLAAGSSGGQEERLARDAAGGPGWPRGPAVAPAASADPRSHGRGLLWQGRKIMSIHDRSIPKPCGNICPCTGYMQHFAVHTCGLEFFLNEVCTSHHTQTTVCLKTRFSSPRTWLFKPTQWQRIPKEQQNIPGVIFIVFFPPALFLTIHCYCFVSRKKETRPNTNVFKHTAIFRQTVFISRTA